MRVLHKKVGICPLFSKIPLLIQQLKNNKKMQKTGATSLFLLKINLMITKEKFIDSLSKLPEKFSIDELLEHAIFIEKVQKGLNDATKGKINSKQQAKQKLSAWLK